MPRFSPSSKSDEAWIDSWEDWIQVSSVKCVGQYQDLAIRTYVVSGDRKVFGRTWTLHYDFFDGAMVRRPPSARTPGLWRGHSPTNLTRHGPFDIWRNTHHGASQQEPMTQSKAKTGSDSHVCFRSPKLGTAIRLSISLSNVLQSSWFFWDIDAKHQGCLR